MQNPVRFVEGCKQNEDVIFSAKMFFCSQKLLYLDKFLYIYRKNQLSSTSTFQYTIDNVIEIPKAWDEAKLFAFVCLDCDESVRMKWKDFCETTSSIRCLEMVSLLAEQGIDYPTIYNVLKNELFFVEIDNLDEDELAEWQKKDLVLYKKNKVKFCKKKKNLLKNIVRKIMHVKLVGYFVDLHKYNLSIDDLKTV